jgi:hypothetical protein
VAQHQQLGVLGQIRADQHRQQAEQAPQQPVDELQQHPEMVPATPLIPQQNPSSQHETGFPSGTPPACGLLHGLEKPAAAEAPSRRRSMASCVPAPTQVDRACRYRY